MPCARGCGTAVAPKDREHHLSVECPCVEVACPNADVGCGWKDKRSESDAHRLACAFTPLRPALLVYQKHILEHQQMIVAQQTMISDLKAENALLAEVVRDLILQHQGYRPTIYVYDEKEFIDDAAQQPSGQGNRQRVADLNRLKERFPQLSSGQTSIDKDKNKNKQPF
jgi:hypothetical protein